MKMFLAFAAILAAVLSTVVLSTQFGIYQRIPLVHFLIAAAGLGYMIWLTWRDYSHKRLVADIAGAALFSGFLWWTLSYSEYEGGHKAKPGRVIYSELAGVSLKDATGAEFNMSSELSKHEATLIVFYRGFW